MHDTVEDTDTTLDEIEETFGEEVRRIVDEVTDDKSLPKAERKRLQVLESRILVIVNFNMTLLRLLMDQRRARKLKQ